MNWSLSTRKTTGQLGQKTLAEREGFSYSMAAIHVGVSENVVYPIVPNGFADHYPVFKFLFHWEYIYPIFRQTHVNPEHELHHFWHFQQPTPIIAPVFCHGTRKSRATRKVSCIYRRKL